MGWQWEGTGGCRIANRSSDGGGVLKPDVLSVPEVEFIADHVGEANQDIRSWWEVGKNIDNNRALGSIF